MIGTLPFGMTMVTRQKVNFGKDTANPTRNFIQWAPTGGRKTSSLLAMRWEIFSAERAHAWQSEAIKLDISATSRTPTSFSPAPKIPDPERDFCKSRTAIETL